MSENSPRPEQFFVYFADPMCSWCYGFAPVMAQLVRHFEGRLGFRIVMGGLRPSETRPLRAKDKAYLRETWTRVGAASGQPFDLTFLDRDAFTYDTEPACRAVITARQSSDAAAFELMEAISSAFYAKGQDVTQPDVLADIAEQTGFERAKFATALVSPEMRHATLQDFAFTKQAAVEGFPCLLAGSEARGYTLVTHGFRPIDGLPDAIEAWLAGS